MGFGVQLIAHAGHHTACTTLVPAVALDMGVDMHKGIHWARATHHWKALVDGQKVYPGEYTCSRCAVSNADIEPNIQWLEYSR